MVLVEDLARTDHRSPRQIYRAIEQGQLHFLESSAAQVFVCLASFAERTANNNSLAYGDQGNSDSDKEITRKIRQGFMADDQYSTTAKNVKIITVDGKITLQGFVNSNEEKTRRCNRRLGASAPTSTTPRSWPSARSACWCR